MLIKRINPRIAVIKQFSTFLVLDAKENSSDTKGANKNTANRQREISVGSEGSFKSAGSIFKSQVNNTDPWKPILRLEKNMRLLMESCPDPKTPYTTPYLLRYFWQEACFTKSIWAKHHLSAYLEEACYWATNKIHDLLCSQDKNFWLDCFQIARQAALTPQIFSKYNDSRGMKLKTYLQFKIERYLLEVLRKGQEATSYSDWGLLRDISKKSLKNALKQVDITEPQLSRCMLAWQDFKEIYTPTQVRRQLQPPTPEELAAIAEYYNLCARQQAALSGDDIKSADDINILLKICIKAARASTAIPQSVSWDDPNYLEEDFDHPNNEHLRPPTPENLQEQAERSNQRQQIRAVLAQAIAELPQSAQTMLLLEHGLGLEQTNIGKAMSLPQYQVSRDLKKYKDILSDALTKWSKNQLGIELSHDKINELKGMLNNEWLKLSCRPPFDNCLRTTLQEELKDEIPLLKRYYGQGLSQVEVANQLNLSENDVNQRLEQVKQNLQARLYNWVKDTYNLSPDALNSAAKTIAKFVEKWLTNAKYSSFEI